MAKLTEASLLAHRRYHGFDLLNSLIEIRIVVNHFNTLVDFPSISNSLQSLIKVRGIALSFAQFPERLARLFTVSVMARP